METYSDLRDLLARNLEAKHYFKTLPPDVRTAMQESNISTFEELKAKATHMLRAPF